MGPSSDILVRQVCSFQWACRKVSRGSKLIFFLIGEPVFEQLALAVGRLKSAKFVIIPSHPHPCRFTLQFLDCPAPPVRALSSVHKTPKPVNQLEPGRKIDQIASRVPRNAIGQIKLNYTIEQYQTELDFSKKIEVSSTSRASVAQLVRARDCQSLGRWFDSG